MVNNCIFKNAKRLISYWQLREVIALDILLMAIDASVPYLSTQLRNMIKDVESCSK